MRNDDTFEPYERKFETQMELLFEANGASEHHLGNRMRAWFIAPATTRYRFYMTCDDRCSLLLGEAPDDSENLTTVIDDVSWAWSGRRVYLKDEK
jgi:hypothetical protein